MTRLNFIIQHPTPSSSSSSSSSLLPRCYITSADWITQLSNFRVGLESLFPALISFETWNVDSPRLPYVNALLNGRAQGELISLPFDYSSPSFALLLASELTARTRLPHLYLLFIYLYIYVCVCVCVCLCKTG